MLKEFANTTHHNFRPELKDRIYNWYFHKFVRMPKEDGFMGCVDCNRCVIFCPAKINYRVTLARLIKDWEGGK
jgi:Fe-S oxidoreductase